MVTNAELTGLDSQLILILPWEVFINFQNSVLKFKLLLATEFLRTKFSHISGTVGESQSPFE